MTDALSKRQVSRLQSFLLALFILMTGSVCFAKEEISRQQAIQAVKEVHQGKVLKAQKKGASYNVKLLTKDGRVKQIKVDSQTGKVLQRSGKK